MKAFPKSRATMDSKVVNDAQSAAIPSVPTIGIYTTDTVSNSKLRIYFSKNSMFSRRVNMRQCAGLNCHWYEIHASTIDLMKIDYSIMQSRKAWKISSLRLCLRIQ
jgi:hypothetical protein